MDAKTVLVVDDDASGRAMLSLSLRQAGFRVQTAAGGLEALGILQREPFDWLVTDARMAPMDGFELSRRAKQLRPSLHIAMMSALCTERDAAGYSIEKFYTKPVAVADLVCRISA